jgi:hypothetical protein
MADSSIQIVTLAKLSTSLSINVSPTSGKPPLTVTIDGMLLDEYGAGVPARDIELLIDGVVVATDATTTEASQIGPGYYVFYYQFTAVGDHTVQTHFAGDTEYEGCEEKYEVGTPNNVALSLLLLSTILLLL